MTDTIIYAELLSNIRQISILAEFSAPADANTRVSISADRKRLSLTHAGNTTELELPADINPSYVAQQPSPGLTHISLRVPLVPQPSQTNSQFAEAPSAPWNASDLNNKSAFACRHCNAAVVPAGTVKTWQDLPSANWAEMMDFWHCHKPEVPKSEKTGAEGRDLEQKGYAAGNASFRAQKGVGKVDLMSFLLSKEDCAVLMPSDISNLSTKPEAPTTCHCANCKAVLGVFDSSVEDCRLNKWELTLMPSSSPPLSHFLIPYLVSLTAALAVSKFLVHDPDTTASNPTNLFVWLFAPNLTVSFGHGEKAGPTKPMKAAKLFYKRVVREEAEKLMDSPDASVEEVKLPNGDVAGLLGTLKSSTERLPSSSRRFGEWDVGILERAD